MLALVGAEVALIAAVAAIQLWRNRPNLPAMMLCAAWMATFSLHLMPEAQRIALGVAGASLAGATSSLVAPGWRRRFHLAMAAAWLGQFVFPEARDIAGDRGHES